MLQFQLTYTIGDIINTSLLILAIIGLSFTFYQIRQEYCIQKATFFKELYLFLITEPEQKDAFYLILHGKFTFDECFHGTKQEKSVDSLLCFLDLICALHAQKMLTKQEMYFFEYCCRTTYMNRSMQKYFEYLRNAFQNTETLTMPFIHFISYCQRELRLPA